MSDQNQSGPIVASITPAARFTVPDFADYHLISDYELIQLTKPETGVLGTIGWAAAGGAVGFAVSARRALATVSEGHAITADDLWSAMLCVGLAACALICLILHYRNASSLKTLAGQIRSRRQHVPN